MNRFAFVDIETIGCDAQSGNIIEIAIVTHNGVQCEEEFHSLIKPKKPICRKTTLLTGISQEMVSKAPSFWSLAKKIVQLTEGRILVGHNISFDYGFLRSSFRELGFNFERECLCTLRMARQCLPKCNHYNLGSLAAGLRLPKRRLHRALSDVKTTIDLFLKLEGNGLCSYGLKTLSPALMKDPSPSIPVAAVGVYKLRDKDGKIIYVGRSVDLKTRIKQHIYFQKHQAPKNRILHQHIAHVEFEILGHELIAAIEELHLIKKYRPRFNAIGKRKVFKFKIFIDSNSMKYGINSKASTTENQLYIDSFGSKRIALLALESLPKIPHIFSSARAKKIWINRLLRKHDYPKKNLTFSVTGCTNNERYDVYIEKGRYRGYAFSGLQREYRRREEFPDIKRLIRSYFSSLQA